MKRVHYGWVIAVLSAVVFAFYAMRMYTFGVFLVPLTDEFHWSRGALSWASSLAAIVSGPLSILIGRLSDRYGPRVFVTISGILTAGGFLLMSQVSTLWQVYLVWGLIMGTASACAYIPIMSTIPRWFTARRTTAIGIAITGFGMAALIWPPAAQSLITSVDWRKAFLVLAVISAVVVIPLAQFLRSHPRQMRLLPYGEDSAPGQTISTTTRRGLSLREAARTPGFWLFGPTMLCFFSSLNVMFVHIVAHARDIGISPIIAASTLSIIGGASIVGRLSVGTLFDRIGIRKALVGSVSLGVIALLLLVLSPATWSFYLFTIIYGLSYGSFVPMETAVPAELFGISSLGIIMATLGLIPTFGSALAPPLAGAIFDATRDYHIAFVICLALMFIALVLSIILLRLKDRTKLNNIS